MRRRHQGLSLIELMISLAFISFLNTVALSVYQNYERDARRVAEELSGAACRVTIQRALRASDENELPSPADWDCRGGH